MTLSKKIGLDTVSPLYSVIFLLLLLWFPYPGCYGLPGDGTFLQGDSEAVFYGIPDLIVVGALPVLFVPLASAVGLKHLGQGLYDQDLKLVILISKCYIPIIKSKIHLSVL